MCVRGDAADADTDTRPMYGCMLTVTAPQRYVGAHTASITLNGTMPSCSDPADVDMENPWCYLDSNNVHRDSKEVQLVICVTKSNVHH